jgi:hypothetical protein
MAHPSTRMFVNEDGGYGAANDMFTFEYGDLTEEQWDNVRALDERDRFDYIAACVNRDTEEQARILGDN